MKKLIILFLLLPSLLFSQVSPSKIVRIANASTVFGAALSYGTYLEMQSNNKTYKIISVNGVAGTAMFTDLVLNTDYIEEGTVTAVSTAAANNGVTATWSMASPTPALTIGLGAITPSSVNGLTLTALATGFTVAGGTTSKTLTVPLDASVSGTNTGDQTTITGNAGSATSLAGGSGGTIPYQSAAGTTAMLANGTAGQVLQSNGTTLAPSWAAAGAGDMILAGVQTVTGAKTFGSAGAVGKLIIAGTTSGSTILNATAVAGSGTVTLPTTGTLTTLAGTETLTNKDLTSGTNTFPTFNQNTSGSAASFTGNLAGDVTGPQATTVVVKINGTSLAGLATGILKNTTTTGVPSIAIAGTDYVAPNAAITGATNTKITYDAKGLVTSGSAATLASADFANQGTTTTLLHGNAAGNPSFGQIVTADITDANVTYAKIQNIGALSLMGRSANTVGVGADIAATAASNAVLRESGSTIGFGSINLASSGAVGTSILPIANGGTNSATQNWVDLTTAQTAAGAKTWSALGTFTGGITTTGVNTLSFGADASGQTISLGTGAAAKLITLGSSSGASSLTQLVGTGNYSLDGVGASTYVIGASTTGGAITIGGTAQTGTIGIGAGTGAQTVNLGTGGTGIKTINIGTGAIDNVVTVGTTTGAASVALKTGTGNLTVTAPTSIFNTSTATDDQIKITPFVGGAAARFTGIITSADLTVADKTWTFPNTTGTIGLLTKIAGASGAAGLDETWQALTSNSADNTTVTPAVVMTTTGVDVGVWSFKYTLIFQTAALNTGIRIANNHTGTVTTYIMNSRFVSTGGGAATGIHDGISTVQTAGLNEGFAERVINTSSKASAGVGTINANQLIIIEGTIVVSVSGDLELKLGSELAGTAVRAMAGSTLQLLKIQ